MNEDSFYTVGELAKKCGVTVRTLQYYDECKLLTPNRYSEGGRRLYGIDDVLRLQQILFFKSFGFSLEEIRDRLMNVDSAKDFAEILANQKSVIEEQIRHLQKVVDLMNEAIENTSNDEELSIDLVVAMLDTTRRNDFYSYVVKNMDNDSRKSLIMKKASLKTERSDWDFLLSKLKTLYKSGADPFGGEGQELAEEWWNRIIDLTGGDPDLIASVFSTGESLSSLPEDEEEVKMAIEKFLSPALGNYLQKQGIVPPGMEDDVK